MRLVFLFLKKISYQPGKERQRNGDSFYSWVGLCSGRCVLSRSVVSEPQWAHQAPLSMQILQARILEWVAIPSSRGSSWPRDWTQVSLIEIKICLLLGRKFMINLDSILKSRDITLSTKFGLIKAVVFPVVMYGCESWTIKKAERQRINAFELWCWKRLLRVPWTARRSNQSILKEISPGCSLEGLMLKLKLLILWSPDAKNWLIGKDPDAGKDWGQEEKGMTENEMVGWHHRLSGHKFG